MARRAALSTSRARRSENGLERGAMRVGPRRRLLQPIAGLTLVATLLLAGGYAVHRYDQQAIGVAMHEQQARDQWSMRRALATVEAHDATLRQAQRRADLVQQARALATAAVAIPTRIALAAVAAAHATGTAVAAAEATATARAWAAATATAVAQPGAAYVCTALHYNPTTGLCAAADARMTVGEAGDGRLVVALRHVPALTSIVASGAPSIAIAVEQRQPDGSVAHVKTASGALDPGADHLIWRLGDLLPTNLFGNVAIGQYRLIASINGQSLRPVSLTVYPQIH